MALTIMRWLGRSAILSVSYWTVGELRDAQINIERALAIFQVSYDRDHPEVAKTFVNLGAVQRDLGELMDARASIERGLAIYEAAYGPIHPRVAATLLSLGEVQLRLWKLRDAQISIVRAATILKTTYELDPYFLGVSLNRQGREVFRGGRSLVSFSSSSSSTPPFAQNGGRSMTALSSIRKSAVRSCSRPSVRVDEQVRI